MEEPRFLADRMLGKLARWLALMGYDARLTEVRREDVLAELPERVRTFDTRFYRCPSCRHLYWLGTHVERARAVLARLGLV